MNFDSHKTTDGITEVIKMKSKLFDALCKGVLVAGTLCIFGAAAYASSTYSDSGRVVAVDIDGDSQLEYVCNVPELRGFDQTGDMYNSRGSVETVLVVEVPSPEECKALPGRNPVYVLVNGTQIEDSPLELIVPYAVGGN
jgi:hypothetical protein